MTNLSTTMDDDVPRNLTERYAIFEPWKPHRDEGWNERCMTFLESNLTYASELTSPLLVLSCLDPAMGVARD